MLPTPFPVARYHLRGIVERRIDFPDFAGSALRGAFGHALRRAACVTALEHCPACPLYRRCAYPAIFETPPPENARRAYANLPQPYVMEPPAPGALTRNPGQAFDFSIVLIGPALTHLPLIASAMQTALRDIGRGSVKLARIEAEGTAPRLDAAHPTAPSSETVGVIIPPAPTELPRITLSLDTPFALARNGKELPTDQITARDVLMAAVRRTAELAEWQLNQPIQADFPELAHLAEAANIRIEAHRLQFSRHSARQRRDMPMRGIIGDIHLEGELRPFWPFLHLGQWLHIGKKCVFGFGRYTLQF